LDGLKVSEIPMKKRRVRGKVDSTSTWETARKRKTAMKR
jgi:hypothetical protein